LKTIPLIHLKAYLHARYSPEKLNWSLLQTRTGSLLVWLSGWLFSVYEFKRNPLAWIDILLTGPIQGTVALALSSVEPTLNAAQTKLQTQGGEEEVTSRAS
jgi:hypothetical protein